MADTQRVTAIRIQRVDGTITDEIPIGAKAENVDMANKYDAQETIGEIDVPYDGSIADQLGNLVNDLQTTVTELNAKVTIQGNTLIISPNK